MEASQPAYRAGPVDETTFILCSYGEIPARLPRQKLDTCQKETRAHCLDKQRMSNSDIFISVAGMECSYGKIFIPLTEISPVHQ